MSLNDQHLGPLYRSGLEKSIGQRFNRKCDVRFGAVADIGAAKTVRPSFNHLVGATEQRQRLYEPEGLCSLKISAQHC